jgi:hypothetical protein
MSKKSKQMVGAVVVLAVAIGAQIKGVDIAAALSVAGAILAYLSGYNTLNPGLRDDTEEDS